MEAPLKIGEGDDQRAGVGRRQQHPEARARQRPPLVVGVVGRDAEAAPRLGRGLLSGRAAIGWSFESLRERKVQDSTQRRPARPTGRRAQPLPGAVADGAAGATTAVPTSPSVVPCRRRGVVAAPVSDAIRQPAADLDQTDRRVGGLLVRRVGVDAASALWPVTLTLLTVSVGLTTRGEPARAPSGTAG